MAKNANALTPTQRAQRAESARKAASGRARNLNEQLDALKKSSAAKLRALRAAAANQGVQALGAAAAGGAVAGSLSALIETYGGGLGATVGAYLKDPRINGAVVGVLGAGGVMLAERSKGKGRQTMMNVAAGIAAGGAAIAARPLVKGLLPGNVQGLRIERRPAALPWQLAAARALPPAPVGALRVNAAAYAAQPQFI